MCCSGKVCKHQQDLHDGVVWCFEPRSFTKSALYCSSGPGIQQHLWQLALYVRYLGSGEGCDNPRTQAAQQFAHRECALSSESSHVKRNHSHWCSRNLNHNQITKEALLENQLELKSVHEVVWETELCTWKFMQGTEGPLIVCLGWH